MNIADFKSISNEDAVADTLQYQTELFAGAWRDNKLRPEIRYKLLQSAKMFIDTIEIPGFKILDIILTGSMANYNWTKFSDFDVHVVTRYSDLKCDDLAAEFYRAKKNIWNQEHDILVRGHEVELYVQDVTEPHVSSGVYSLLDNKWLVTPEKITSDIDQDAVRKKSQDLMKQIDVALEQADDPDDVKRIQKKITHMRKSGLEKAGEFSVENLTFKVLRNTGYLAKLKNARNSKIDKILSVSENFKDGKGPGRPGDSRRVGIPKNTTLAQLERIRSSETASPRKKQLAHWQINMRRGQDKKIK
jgi:predicted nucleotidyltransferase